jgi:hypothetical protein
MCKEVTSDELEHLLAHKKNNKVLSYLDKNSKYKLSRKQKTPEEYLNFQRNLENLFGGSSEED